MGPGGVQNGVRFLVHPYACEIGRGDRLFSPDLRGWGAHGYDSFCWRSLDLGEPEQKWYPPLAGWLAGWAGLAGLGFVASIFIYIL